MRSYSEAWEAAVDQPPFSNGTEGYAWQANWCDQCKVDAKFRRTQNGEDGCPLLAVAIVGRTPAEWFEQPWRQIKGRPEGQTAPSLGDTYHCVEYRGPGDGRVPEPRPKPEPPQEGLFERPERAVRLLAQPQETRVLS